MSVTRIIISKKGLPKGAKIISVAKIAKSNNRIKNVMQIAIRDSLKKQRISLEKASQLVLNV